MSQLKSKATKKAILEGARISHEYGYWSTEVREYLNQFTYEAESKINTALISVYVGHQRKSSIWYDLFKEHGYITEY